MPCAERRGGEPLLRCPEVENLGPGKLMCASTCTGYYLTQSFAGNAAPPSLSAPEKSLKWRKMPNETDKAQRALRQRRNLSNISRMEQSTKIFSISPGSLSRFLRVLFLPCCFPPAFFGWIQHSSPGGLCHWNAIKKIPARGFPGRKGISAIPPQKALLSWPAWGSGSAGWRTDPRCTARRPHC